MVGFSGYITLFIIYAVIVYFSDRQSVLSKNFTVDFMGLTSVITNMTQNVS